jgi:hypothetical protein
VSGQLAHDGRVRVATDEAHEQGMTRETRDAAAVPVDLSKKGLVGWVSLVRLTALDLPPKSATRDAFLALAVRNLHYAAFLLRGSRARVDYLNTEAGKLPALASTVTD